MGPGGSARSGSCGAGFGCTCGACVAAGSQPAGIDNRPSLPAVAFRHGTFSAVRGRLLAGLGVDPTLSRLSTRRSDDHVVAIIELWSVVSDVIDFYGERYLNEAYVGTATEQRSVLRLARLVGYRPRPGVAALAWMVFTLEAGAAAFLPAGVPVQSVPGPAVDSLPPAPPVTFETLDDLAADSRWNAVAAYTRDGGDGAALDIGQLRTVLDRRDAPTLARALRPGDSVVLWGTTGVEEKIVARVDVAADRAVLEWTTPIAGNASANPDAGRSKRTAALFGANAPAQWMSASAVTASPSNPSGIKWTMNTTSFSAPAGRLYLDLDGKVEGLEVGGRLLFTAQGRAPVAVGIVSVASAQATVGPLSGTVTRVSIDTALPAYNLTTVRVYVLAGPPLTFWAGDYPAAGLGNAVHVPVWATTLADGRTGVEVGRHVQGDAWVPGQPLDLETVDAGRNLIIAWAGPDQPSAPAPLVAQLQRRPQLPGFDAEGFGHLRLDVTFSRPPGPDWVAAAAVTVLGNVARASHGQTVNEVLGNGNGSVAFARFALQRQPVTFLPARVPGGLVSTLAVAVDGVIRPEVATLYEQPATATVVETQTRPDGTTVVEGGDSVEAGARFTSGVGNVTARYRYGSGLAGRVDADRLTTLLHPPAGVRSARNPLPSEGGADPESLAGARQNAPASVRTLGRIVSLRDIDDLVLATGLVAKAETVWVWSGYDRVIHLTVAAPAGAALSADLRETIGAGLDAARDTSRRLRVDDRVLVPITCALNVVISHLAERPDRVSPRSTPRCAPSSASTRWRSAGPWPSPT
jgi:hypothetical protein